MNSIIKRILNLGLFFIICILTISCAPFTLNGNTYVVTTIKIEHEGGEEYYTSDYINEVTERYENGFKNNPELFITFTKNEVTTNMFTDNHNRVIETFTYDKTSSNHYTINRFFDMGGAKLPLPEEITTNNKKTEVYWVYSDHTEYGFRSILYYVATLKK